MLSIAQPKVTASVLYSLCQRVNKVELNRNEEMDEIGNIIVKWSGKDYPITGLQNTNTVIQLKNLIYAETGVLPGRQKLLGLKCSGECIRTRYGSLVDRNVSNVSTNLLQLKSYNRNQKRAVFKQFLEICGTNDVGFCQISSKNCHFEA